MINCLKTRTFCRVWLSTPSLPLRCRRLLLFYIFPFLLKDVAAGLRMSRSSNQLPLIIFACSGPSIFCLWTLYVCLNLTSKICLFFLSQILEVAKELILLFVWGKSRKKFFFFWLSWENWNWVTWVSGLSHGKGLIVLNSGNFGWTARAKMMSGSVWCQRN